jgi:TRAP-type C4-dicarboxylate transport system substrate-binding protein
MNGARTCSVASRPASRSGLGAAHWRRFGCALAIVAFLLLPAIPRAMAASPWDRPLVVAMTYEFGVPLGQWGASIEQALRDRFSGLEPFIVETVEEPRATLRRLEAGECDLAILRAEALAEELRAAAEVARPDFVLHPDRAAALRRGGFLATLRAQPTPGGVVALDALWAFDVLATANVEITEVGDLEGLSVRSDRRLDTALRALRMSPVPSSVIADDAIGAALATGSLDGAVLRAPVVEYLMMSGTTHFDTVTEFRHDLGFAGHGYLFVASSRLLATMSEDDRREFLDIVTEKTTFVQADLRLQQRGVLNRLREMDVRTIEIGRE